MPAPERAERCVALAERCPVQRRQLAAAGEDPRQGAVEVGAPRRRAALHDREPVGREDERRELAPQLLGGADRRAVQAAPASARAAPA